MSGIGRPSERSSTDRGVLFRFRGALYDRELSVDFLGASARDEFRGVEALKRQVALDMETARRLLAEDAVDAEGETAPI